MERREGCLYGLGMDGRRIRAARVARDMTLKEVGDAMGVSPQAVAQWEKSNPNFDHMKLSKLAGTLRVDYKWLLINTNIESVPAPEDVPEPYNRVPILLRDECFLYSLFKDTDLSTFNKLPSLEPTYEISNGSFAVVIEENDANSALKGGDICIFDPSIIPNDDDIVIWFRVLEGLYRGSYGRNGDVSGKRLSAENLYLERNKAYLQRAQGRGPVDGIVVLAVMVELRRLRPLHHLQAATLWRAD